ncbi:hypothetical protein BC938DRAFT_475173 [Jimgerdemannia flammicorona]|uniref:GIY-YIG domain-containing protein n=1 Tax=Jimgerdemannia flammicorona TaxID=994334 RepID=A0A433QRV1_9FUNG|nr:hypothetical protein BC938DRAFT_475173 [Jimgerdemannia flammicorona]
MTLFIAWIIILVGSNSVILCEGESFPTAALPSVMQFENLNITDNFASAIKSLKGLAGIYAIRCVITGAIYIGSTIDLSKRMNEHFFHSSNIHLRNAIAKYGIGAFVFIVVEFVEIIAGTSPSEIKALLLSREQLYLNWLFSLPASCRFNFLPPVQDEVISTRQKLKQQSVQQIKVKTIQIERSSQILKY